MEIKILTDTAADLSSEEISKHNIGIITMPVLFDGDSENTTDINEFWAKLIKGKIAKTSQPSPEAILKEFTKAKENNYALVVVLISSKLSGTYQTTVMLKNEVAYEHIYIIDSLNASIAEKITVLKACELRDQGMEAKDIYEYLEEFKSRVKLYACIDTLTYLARGGRLSKTAANIGNIVNLKPIITLHEGEVKVINKCIGNTRATAKLIDIAKNATLEEGTIFHPIYAYSPNNLETLITKMEHKSITNIYSYRAPIGSTIGTHIGPGGYGIIFVEKK